MNEPRKIRFDASGLSFAALEWGPPDGPLALCLHGYPDTAWTWRHLGPHLGGRGWHVVAPFMRGYAPTELAEDGAYQIGALVRDIADAHAALGADERAVLIGHDWGAIATYVAGAHAPGLFARMVTMAVPPLPLLLAPLMHPAQLVPRLPLVARQLRCSWYIFFQQIPVLSERLLPRIVRRLWDDWSPGFDAREDVARVVAALEGPGRRTAALRYYRAFVQPWYRRRAYAAEQSHWLGLPQVPVLYLHGSRDGCLLAPLAENAEESLPPGSRAHVLPGVGHFMQLEDPQTVNDLITEFVEQPHADHHGGALAAR